MTHCRQLKQKVLAFPLCPYSTRLCFTAIYAEGNVLLSQKRTSSDSDQHVYVEQREINGAGYLAIILFASRRSLSLTCNL